MPVRKIGDRIQFRGVSFVWSEKRIYEGTIAAVIDEGDEKYYHVDAMSEHVEDGIVYECEVVSKPGEKEHTMKTGGGE